MPIRNNLKVLMAQRNVKSFSELSRKTGFHYATIRHFAIGLHQRLDSKLIEAICKELDCDIEDLLYIEEKEA
jgi:DNA-binding Xre family transcriptional regulator